MSHIHILFTMLIILNITTNWLYCFNNVKTSYMLDFNEVFWHADKRWKMRKTLKKRGKTHGKRKKLAESAENFAENCGFWNFSGGRIALQMEPTWTQRVANADFKTWTCCVADADYLPTCTKYWLQVWGCLLTYGLKKFSSVWIILSDCPSVWEWNAILNWRSVPSKSNNVRQNLPVNRGSWSDIITSGRPCSRKTLSTKIWAYSMAVTSFFHRARCTILVNLSTKTTMAVKPFDFGKSVMRSVVTWADFLEGISRGFSNLVFALLSDFIIWHVEQVFTY